MTPSPGRGDGVATRERTIAKPAETAERAEMRRLLREFNKTRDPRIRERLVELNSDLVHYIARRFANRGEPLEDIEQVGFLGLIQAIERFDPSLENEFSTFATPTIAGEIRRHFRDRSWAVRVPRRLQENLAKVNAATQQLQNELGRSPSVAEIGGGWDSSPTRSSRRWRSLPHSTRSPWTARSVAATNRSPSETASGCPMTTSIASRCRTSSSR